MAWAYFLCHQPFPSLSPLTVLGKPRQYLPATTLRKPAIKASQGPFLLSSGHSLARCLCNGLTALWGLCSRRGPAMQATLSVSQRLRFAGVASGSSIGSAFDLQSHCHTPLGCYESVEGTLTLPLRGA